MGMNINLTRHSRTWLSREWILVRTNYIADDSVTRADAFIDG